MNAYFRQMSCRMFVSGNLNNVAGNENENSRLCHEFPASVYKSRVGKSWRRYTSLHMYFLQFFPFEQFPK